jgi:hypothetical protein
MAVTMVTPLNLVALSASSYTAKTLPGSTPAVVLLVTSDGNHEAALKRHCTA